MYTALIHVLVSGAICWVLCIGVDRLLIRLRLMDVPNQRSSHTQPTVRGGGLAIIPAVVGVVSWLGFHPERRLLLVIGACVLALAVVSFLDDLRSVRVSVRLGCHLVAAAIALVALGMSSRGFAFSPGGAMPLSLAAGGLFAGLWVVGYTNAFNFMDGINGIAAGQAAITGIGMALLAILTQGDNRVPPVLLSSAVAGAAIGFLPFNFPKARMFMGDVGSAPLGFLLGILVIWLSQSVGTWLLIPLALLHANFVLDTAITLLRRIARGERWHQAHREHFYQRLVRSGRSHAFVTGCQLGLQSVVLGLMCLYLEASAPVRAALAALVILLWLSFFAFCEMSFRRHAIGPSAS